MHTCMVMVVTCRSRTHTQYRARQTLLSTYRTQPSIVRDNNRVIMATDNVPCCQLGPLASEGDEREGKHRNGEHR